MIHELWRDLTELDERIAWVTGEFERIAAQDVRTRALFEVPGVGAIVATALVAAVGDGRAFGRGRHLAAWLGLVPQQYSTSSKTRLLGISKQGNSYLRILVVHGARAV